jgi:hypothetical protein
VTEITASLAGLSQPPAPYTYHEAEERLLQPYQPARGAADGAGGSPIYARATASLLKGPMITDVNQEPNALRKVLPSGWTRSQ